jgi:hypothetical protein
MGGVLGQSSVAAQEEHGAEHSLPLLLVQLLESGVGLHAVLSSLQVTGKTMRRQDQR